MGDAMKNFGLVIRDDKKYKLVELENITSMEEIDYLTFKFRDRDKFISFLSRQTKSDFNENTDIYIYSSTGPNSIRFRDLIFSRNDDYLDNLRAIKNKDKVDFNSIFYKCLNLYKNNPSFKILFENGFGKEYGFFIQAIKYSKDGIIEYGKNNWLRNDYNNFREVVRVLDYYYKNRNISEKEANIICHNDIVKDNERLDIKDAVLAQLNEGALQSDLFSSINSYYISEDDINKALSNDREKIVDSMLEEMEKGTSLKSLPLDVVGNYNYSKISDKEKEARKNRMIKYLSNNDAFPIDAIKKNDKEYYLDVDVIAGDYDEKSKDLLRNKLTSNLLEKLYVLKNDYKRLDDMYERDGFYNSNLKGEIEETSKKSVVDHFDTLIKANNMTSFNKVYEFCLFLDHINNNKGYDYGGKTR